MDINYFKTLSGILKPIQMICNVAVSIVTQVGYSKVPFDDLLFFLSILNLFLGLLIMIIRLTLKNNQNVIHELGKFEYGLYSISTVLYFVFSMFSTSSTGWWFGTSVMCFGFLSSILYAIDAFDKHIYFMGIDNKSYYQYQKFHAPNQGNPIPGYSQGFQAYRH